MANHFQGGSPTILLEISDPEFSHASFVQRFRPGEFGARPMPERASSVAMISATRPVSHGFREHVGIG